MASKRLTKAEAYSVRIGVQRHFQTAVSTYIEFIDREGWKALGYSSPEACIRKEFPFYRQSIGAGLKLPRQ